jgi:hypothetical protein
MLQEILSDAQWRQVPVLPESRDAALLGNEAFTPRQAGEVARELLGQLIASAGPSVYEQIERRAIDEVAEATSAGDVELLLRIAEVYPNSTAAQQALSESARLLQQQNRLREAAKALRRLAARSEDPLPAWLTLAQIDASRPGRLEVAAGRMRRASRLRGDAPAPTINLPGDVRIEGLSVEQAAFKLTEASLAAQIARLPDFGLPDDPMQPLFAEQPTSVAGVDALLVPQEGFERHDRIVVLRTDGTLAAYAFGANEPQWSVSLEQSGVEAIAWIPQGLLVWGDSAIALLDAQSGTTTWRRTAEALASPSTENGGPDRAVVASGWRPAPQELDLGEAESVAQQRLQQRAFEQRGGRGAWRREEMLRNQERLEAIAQQRRANAANEQGADNAGRTTPAISITGVVPSAGTIGVIVNSSVNGAAGVLAENGEVQWRALLPEGEVAAAQGGGDFLAIQTTGSRSVLTVLDLDTGLLATRRSFELAGSDPLANFLVTPENELITVTRQQVTGIDLERQPQGARFAVRADALGQNAQAFAASAGPGRVRVIGEKALVLVDPHRVTPDQEPRRDALVIDLNKGRPDTFTDPASGAQVVVVLGAAESGAGDADADALPPRLRAQQRMRMLQAQREAARLLDRPGLPGERIWSAGTSVYITADRGLSAYDLAIPGRHWSRLNAPMMREFDPSVNLGVAIGQGDLLLFDQPMPVAQRQVSQPTLRVTSFSRDRLKDGRESGQWRHEVELVPGTHELDAPIVGFQPADGGLAVLTSGGRLLFLRGKGSD